MSMRPTIPEIDERIDFVVQALIDGCDAPVTVWIEKFWPAFTQLVLEWYVLDLKNIFTAYLRPQLYAIEGRSSRHWGGGKKGKRGTLTQWVTKYLTFDPGEFIGKHLWGGEELRARAVPPLARWMWIFEGTIERFLWYCLVLDLVTEFAYRWSSSVMETRYCQAARDSVFLGRLNDILLIGIFGWQAMGPYEVLKMRHINFYNGFGVGIGAGNGVAAFSISYRLIQDPFPGCYVKVRVRCLSGPNGGKEAVTEQLTEHARSGDVGTSHEAQPGDVWIAEVIANGAHMADTMFFNVHGAIYVKQ